VEYTKAEVVRGGNVATGPGCTIDLVEYGNGLEQDKRAKVRKTQENIVDPCRIRAGLLLVQWYQDVEFLVVDNS